MLYYGDELGMPQTEVPHRLLDPVGLRFYPVAGRDGERTPMPWTGDVATGAGFTAPGVEPWLPFGDVAACNVATQHDDPDSVLSFTRSVLALRRELADLQTGTYTEVAVAGGAWVWRRGETVLVACNLTGTPATVTLDGVRATVRLAHAPGRDGEALDGTVTLAPGKPS